MKALLKCSVFFFLLSSFLACRSDKFDKNTGITSQVDIAIEIINSNPMKANETWTSQKVIDLKAELLKRANIDLTTNDLLTFKIVAVSAGINDTRCKQLSAISTTFNFPATPPFSKTYAFSGGVLQALCGFAKTIDLSKTNDPTNIILTAEYAPGISRGDKITIDYSVTNGNAAFDSATGIAFLISTECQFKPK